MWQVVVDTADPLRARAARRTRRQARGPAARDQGGRCSSCSAGTGTFGATRCEDEAQAMVRLRGAGWATAMHGGANGDRFGGRDQRELQCTPGEPARPALQRSAQADGDRCRRPVHQADPQRDGHGPAAQGDLAGHEPRAVRGRQFGGGEAQQRERAGQAGRAASCRAPGRRCAGPPSRRRARPLRIRARTAARTGDARGAGPPPAEPSRTCAWTLLRAGSGW